MELLHTLLNNLTELAILLFEFIGVGILIVSGVMGLWRCLHHDPRTRLILAKGMSLGLEFKLGSEILRTVVVREFTELLIVAGIILLRAALTFLIHWEIKNEEAQGKEEGQAHA
ncbi:MAG: DUF1622 domain-containing protein [Oscillospiraceae bacterium]|nr:DUF1622 domain-containing protein [Oscillospiraceae bacterium]